MISISGEARIHPITKKGKKRANRKYYITSDKQKRTSTNTKVKHLHVIMIRGVGSHERSASWPLVDKPEVLPLWQRFWHQPVKVLQMPLRQTRVPLDCEKTKSKLEYALLACFHCENCWPFKKPLPFYTVNPLSFSSVGLKTNGRLVPDLRHHSQPFPS